MTSSEHAVSVPESVTPAFGQADLSNCEREQIHFAGSIQPHGALLVVSEPDHEIIQASANAVRFLNQDKELIGRALEELDGELHEAIEPYLSERMRTTPIAVQCRLGSQASKFDCLVHRPAEGGLIIEFERAEPPIDLQKKLKRSVERVIEAASMPILCDEAAKIFRKLTGYDRVMVYRFDDRGHGEVYSEEREQHLEPYLGNRYPATDIPQIARRLYIQNRIRLLVEVDYAPVPLIPRLSPVTGRDLDMSMCSLRSMSPIHLQYLKNMGVCATMVASLVVGGKLWGLVSCHHYAPKVIGYELRAACELLAETVATRIAALESFAQANAELAIRRLEQKLTETVARNGDWQSALFESSTSLLEPTQATGAALIVDDRILTSGDVPGTRDLRQVRRWLDSRPRDSVIATASLGLDEPDLAHLTDVASGVLAVPLSNSRGEYLVWFRPERVQEVTWAGNPCKPVIFGDDPADLSPRRSFAQWRQVVEGTSAPWTPGDLTSARLIGETVADVILQFQSVRMLIAQDQLDKVSRQVRMSDHPVIVTDVTGRILLANEAFDRLLRGGHTHLQNVDDIPVYFLDRDHVRQQLHALVTDGRSWRGEVRLETDRGETRPMLVRADPVTAAQNRVLGFVILFTDLTEQKAAEAARQRFQYGIIEGHRRRTVKLDSEADIAYQNLLSSVVGNAQLAALEITHSLDVSRMPDLLESVQESVDRTANLLQELLRHSSASQSAKSRSDD